jgi:branched-chain amino acid transport system permease protein
MSAIGDKGDFAHALRDAGKTTIISFFLLLPLVGFETVTNIRNELALNTRLPLLLGMVATVGLSRLFYLAIVEPAVARRRALATRRPLAIPKSFSRIFTPFAIGFVIVYPVISLLTVGFSGSLKWVDNFGIQVLIYVMLGWGLNIVVGLAGLLDLGYVAFYAVGAYSMHCSPRPSA